jgi:hypothetical protein
MPNMTVKLWRKIRDTNRISAELGIVELVIIGLSKPATSKVPCLEIFIALFSLNLAP